MVSSISSSTSSWAMMRPSPSQMVSNLFSKLDTDNQGYLEKSDLVSALSEASSSSDSSSVSSSVDEIFSQLDSDSDGKLTEEEMTSGLQQLAEQLDIGFNNMRTTGMEGAMPLPPPPQATEEDTGYTADELTTMASEVTSSDSNLSALMSSIAADFDAADTDGNGRVTAAEAQAYQDSQTVASTSDSSSASSSTSSTSSEAAVLKRIMQLMDSYGSFAQDSSFYGLSSQSSLSISA